jgi:hypothetical protein
MPLYSTARDKMAPGSWRTMFWLMMASFGWLAIWNGWGRLQAGLGAVNTLCAASLGSFTMLLGL